MSTLLASGIFITSANLQGYGRIKITSRTHNSKRGHPHLVIYIGQT